MKLLVTTSLPTLKRFDHPALGRFFTPRMYWNVAGTIEAGMVWAADNDAFHGFNEERFAKMLAALAHKPGCLFVTARDVVGDADATVEMFERYAFQIRLHGLPVAFVAQDGITSDRIPWHNMDALFIGGSDDFKDGPDVPPLVAEARLRGKWVHAGRVNGNKRIVAMRRIGVQSFDGSGFGRFPNKQIPRALAVLDGGSAA